MTEFEKQACLKALHFFKIDGQFADEVASDGQIEIFYNIVFRPNKRLQILCSTQYGKSLFVALACVVVACSQHEVVSVLAPTNEKARIIMRYFVDHLGDHPSFATELEKNTKLDRLRMEESKERIMLKHGGGIFVISVQAGNTKKGVEAAMGAGSKIVIQDESGLIPDIIESTVFRMIAGKGEDAFYCKIGNPFYRNHFLTSWKDPNYHKIFINYERGLREGRYNQAFIEEAKKKPYFGVLFGCQFPDEDMMDPSGYLQLIPDNRILVLPKIGDPIFTGRRILGIDPSGEGKDSADFVVRDRFRAQLVAKLMTTNPKEVAQVGLTLMDKFEVKPEDVVVDSFGIGADVSKEMALASNGKFDVYSVLVGNSPSEEERYNGSRFRRSPDEIDDSHGDLFLNIRALMYFRARTWVVRGGMIIDISVDNSQFKNQLCVIKYKRSLQGNKIQLMSKKEMLQLGISSPNTADAFALTFLRNLDDDQQSLEDKKRIEFEESIVEDRYAIL